jgi:hypothetical protein
LSPPAALRSEVTVKRVFNSMTSCSDAIALRCRVRHYAERWQGRPDAQDPGSCGMSPESLAGSYALVYLQGAGSSAPPGGGTTVDAGVRAFISRSALLGSFKGGSTRSGVDKLVDDHPVGCGTGSHYSNYKTAATSPSVPKPTFLGNTDRFQGPTQDRSCPRNGSCLRLGGPGAPQTVCHWFAKSPCIAGNPRASPFAASHRNRPLCRAFPDLPKTQLLIAMQKVVGSSPISRLRETRSQSRLGPFRVVGRKPPARRPDDARRVAHAPPRGRSRPNAGTSMRGRGEAGPPADGRVRGSSIPGRSPNKTPFSRLALVQERADDAHPSNSAGTADGVALSRPGPLAIDVARVDERTRQQTGTVRAVGIGLRSAAGAETA